MNDLQQELAQYDEEWQSIPEEPSYEDLPDGDYVARINEVRIENAKSSGRLQMVWSLIVTEGPCAGRYIWRYSGLGTPENRKFLHMDLNRCGHKLSKLSELPELLPRLLELVVSVKLKTKDKYQNSYINKITGVDNSAPISNPVSDAPWDNASLDSTCPF